MHVSAQVLLFPLTSTFADILLLSFRTVYVDRSLIIILFVFRFSSFSAQFSIN